MRSWSEPSVKLCVKETQLRIIQPGTDGGEEHGIVFDTETSHPVLICAPRIPGTAEILSQLLAALVLFAAFGMSNAFAQRPVQTFDPFYRGESASRSFYDRYALTAEISYHPAGLLSSGTASSGAVPSAAINPFGLNLRFDYRLGTRLNLGFYVDAAGNTAARALALRWVSLKYFRRQDAVDYAIRLAVDPSSDGRSGFPQMDLGFLYTSLVSPSISTDFAIGIRRVQLGFQQLVSTGSNIVDSGDPFVTQPPPERELLRSRALGWEVHLMTGYNFLFDPAGSNLFFSVMAEGGRYDLVEWIASAARTEDPGRTTTGFRGGVLWLRSGFEIERPSYRFAPFLSIPFKQWAPTEGEWPQAQPRIGLNLMLR